MYIAFIVISSLLKSSTRQLDTLGPVRSSLGRARGSLLVGSAMAGQALRLAVMSLYQFRCVLFSDVELFHRPPLGGISQLVSERRFTGSSLSDTISQLVSEHKRLKDTSDATRKDIISSGYQPSADIGA